MVILRGWVFLMSEVARSSPEEGALTTREPRSNPQETHNPHPKLKTRNLTHTQNPTHNPTHTQKKTHNPTHTQTEKIHSPTHTQKKTHNPIHTQTLSSKPLRSDDQRAAQLPTGKPQPTPKNLKPMQLPRGGVTSEEAGP